MLIASTHAEDIVLDPFSGSGTTAAMAKRLGRRFIGIERHPDYIEASIERIAAEKRLPDEQLAVTPAKRETPRVPFGSFVEQGLLPAGTALFDRQRRVHAMVSPDGTLVSGAQRGSIHKMGATLTGAPSCNGWTFWHFERDGQVLPIDVLRTEHAQQEPLRNVG